MSGVHIVGPVGPHEGLLRTWVFNGLQMVTHVKPQPGDGARLRALSDLLFMVGRFTNNSDLRDSEIQSRYEANPIAEAERMWAIYQPIIAVNPEYSCWQFNNEPVFTKTNAAHKRWQIQQLCIFTRKLIDLATAAGHGVALFNFSRGTPEPEDWPLFYEVWRYAIQQNRRLPRGKQHILSIHQYGSWLVKGPRSLFVDAMYHIRRFEQWIRPTLPADLQRADYVNTESGPDHPGGFEIAYGRNDEGRHALVVDWVEQQVWLATQPGCKGAAFFSLGQEGGFGSFDIKDDPVAAMLAAQHYPKMRPAEAEPGGGGNVSTIGQRIADKLAARLGAKFHDVRTRMERHPEETFSVMDSRQARFLAFHHATGQRTVTAEAIARYHVRTNGWAGIGYHFLIRLGELFFVGDVDTMRAHVAGRNNEALGACITGDYVNAPVAPEDIEVARVLVRVLDEEYEPNKVLVDHSTMLPGHTSCAGRVREILPLLRQTAPPVQAPSGAFLTRVKEGQDIAFNPNTALAKAARLKGFTSPLSEEERTTEGGVTYIGQLFGNTTGEERVFWCKDGDWGNVKDSPAPRVAA